MISLALDIYGLFKMVFGCLWVVVDVFEVVVEFFEVVFDGCRWLQEVLGGCRSFLLLVTTNYAHQRAFTYNTTII